MCLDNWTNRVDQSLLSHDKRKEIDLLTQTLNM